MNGRPLPLRPHHALCLQFFVGKGYGDIFVANMAAVKERLCAEPNQPIILVDGTDCLCAQCPHQQDGVCKTIEKSNRYDRGCLEACGLKIGEVYTWRQLCRIVCDSVALSFSARESICSDCRWDPLCREQQRKLYKSSLLS